jgi:hypothetical protein
MLLVGEGGFDLETLVVNQKLWHKPAPTDGVMYLETNICT